MHITRNKWTSFKTEVFMDNHWARKESYRANQNALTVQVNRLKENKLLRVDQYWKIMIAVISLWHMWHPLNGVLWTNHKIVISLDMAIMSIKLLLFLVTSLWAIKLHLVPIWTIIQWLTFCLHKLPDVASKTQVIFNLVKTCHKQVWGALQRARERSLLHVQGHNQNPCQKG